MFERKIFGALTLSAALMSGTAAMALTTDEVWADWQALMTKEGLTATSATEVKDGDDLRLNGVSLSAPDGTKVTMSEVLLTAQGDGSVQIVPQDIAVIPGSGGETIEVTHEGLSVGVYEDAGGMGYGIVADMLSVAFAGAATAPEVGSGSVLVNALNGRYTREAGAAAVALTAGQFDYTINQPALGQEQTSQTSDMALNGSLTLPEGVDLMALDTPEAFSAALTAGLALTGQFTQGATRTLMTMGPLAGGFGLDMNTVSAVTNVAMNAASAQVDGEVAATTALFTPAGMPAPISVTADSMVFGFGIPIVALAEAGDYTYRVALRNLVLADEGWALFDPSGALPRTPADLDIDLGGKLKIDLIDLMASGETGVPPTSTPELMTMDIRSMGLKLAGAALSGSGAFTFDNSAVALGGPPMPIGNASVRLEGGNKLIDGLIAMGLMTQDDAAGARMMMAMFGKVESEDVLTSDIEAREGGSIFVNGQQIQ